MCGIAGFISKNTAWNEGSAAEVLDRMGCAIAHRGPDGAAHWFQPELQVGLVHRRLAIVDLSPAGLQPMHSASGRFTIVFNGEIYNHAELRRQLETGGTKWRGHSDTETLLEGIERWGLDECLHKCVGMFAFALWDRSTEKLSLVRDRMGEKPLYYGWQEGSFVFSSELKALKAHPHFRGSINPDVLGLYLKYNCIPAPYSIYEDIFKLSPANILEIDPRSGVHTTRAYWSLQQVLSDRNSHEAESTGDTYVGQLEQLLKKSVSEQMIADVPLGAFLSGGVDSSLIVALMQTQSDRPVRTFSIGFEEEQYNEAVHAKAVARHLGTEHTELYASPREALEVIPLLPQLYDEPFSDSSQIPTYLVSKMTRRHVTVALSGDAGDELFGGYNRYRLTQEMWSKMSAVSLPLRHILSQLLLSLSPAAWNSVARMLGRSGGNYGDKIHKGASALISRDTSELYDHLISHFTKPQNILVRSSSLLAHKDEHFISDLSDVENMMVKDLVGYLPNDILVKVDRAAMATSLETRAPFLDHRVVEFAMRLPLQYKIRGGDTKWILRQILYKYVPQALIERPKMGFGVPLDVWLRGPLREWAESLLDENRLRREGFFKAEPVRALWMEHLTGKRNWAYHLWDILMFQAWLENENA